uniref:RING-type domain-containing protein n=1 Tax=Parastrongyloides trichosuri TaxID=131310 RepID=A0A0N4ZMS7_PARTI
MNLNTQADYLIPYRCGYNLFNNISFSNDGNFGYFYDNLSTHIIRINLTNGDKTIMKFFDKDYYHKKWIGISIFIISLETVPHLVVLFYNSMKKYYQFVMFSISNNNTILFKLRETKIKLNEELKHFSYHDVQYSVGHGKDDTLIEVIFYQKNELDFWLYQLDCKEFSIVKRKGELLGRGKKRKSNTTSDELRIWEMPFIKDDNVIFLTNNKDKCMAKYTKSLTSNDSFMTVGIDELLPDRRTCTYPDYVNAIWCVSWYGDHHIFVIIVKNRESQEHYLHVWKIEDAIDNNPVCWKKYNVKLKIDKNASNFGIKLTKNKILYIHYDIEKYRDKLHKISLKAMEMNCEDMENSFVEREINIDDEIVRRKKKNSLYVDKELCCPICLELYKDPRNLNCGHSLCLTCCNLLESNINKQEITKKKVACPICREDTEIPSQGLPKNYCLEEAISFILKSKNNNDDEILCSSCMLMHNKTNSFVCLSCMNDIRNDIMIESELINDNICATCILMSHKNHLYINFQHFIKRQSFIHDQREKIRKDIDEISSQFKESVFNLISKSLLSIEQKRLQESVNLILNQETIEKDEKNNDTNFEFMISKEKITDTINNFKSDIKYLENEVIDSLENICEEIIDKRERTITIEMYNRMSKVDSV